MHKLLASFAAASALSFVASAASACDYHDMMATAGQNEQVVAMSTFDGAPPPVTDTTIGAKQTAAPTPACADGDKDCATTASK